MRILYNNLADSMALTDSGELVGFPGTNVQHPFLIKRLRTLGVAATWVKFDAGTGNTVTVDTAAIVQHNLTAGASIHIQANAADLWGSPSVDITATWNAGIILADLGGSQTYRFWRFYLDDPGNTATYLEVGRMGLYPRYQVQEAPDRSLISYVVDSTVISFAPSGQSYADLGPVARVYEIPMGSVQEATRQSLMALYSAVGQFKPVIIIPDENNLTILPPLYAQMMKPTKYTNSGGWLWLDDGLKFKEVF